ncbi:MAG: putative membrane protein [Cognaticolwellia sp.]|jgi:uncharacterized membrane protein
MWWLISGPLSPQGHLEFQTGLTEMVLIAAGVLCAFGLAAWHSRGRAPAWPELVALALGLLAAATALVRPVWVEASGREEPGVLAILVDDSRSMSVLEDGKPRSAQVAQALRQAQRGRSEVFTFGSELGAGDLRSFDQSGSDLNGALQALRERYAGERLAGVVVITDGIVRGGLRERVASPGVTPLELPGPLTVYQVGQAEELSDLAVSNIASGGYAFQKAPFEIAASIQGAGYAGRPVPVSLLEDGVVVATQTVTLDGQGKAQVSFSLERERPGRFVYQVQVPTWDGDAVPENNSLPVSVRVVRDKIRVLQVSGGPSVDQKFLRLFLKQDPAVDLVSFFILRTPDDVAQSPYGPDELSLIEFPYRSLFTGADRDGELDSFDLVIFQNFDYGPYFQRESDDLLGEVADYVAEGGAFVMIGGDRSFDLGDYEGTPLGDVLPVELGLVPKQATDLEPFSPQLSGEGRVHPISRLLGNAEENEQLWERLPPLDGLNLSLGLAPGSAALLQHPTLKTPDGEPLPVVAVREVGKGRSMALMGDSSWRWVMSEAAAGNGNQAYLRFWKNSMRWLMQDRDGQRVRVEASRDNLGIGDSVRLITRVRDVGFEPMEGVPVVGTLQGPKGLQSFEAITNAAGEAVIEMEPGGAGSYQVQVEAGERGNLGQDSTTFSVSARDPELDELLPDSVFLKNFVELQGGVYYAPEETGSPTLDPQAARLVEEEKQTPLWSAPILALVAGLGLGLSWLLRRLRGLR